MAKYNARLVYARPTRGLYEIEPSAAWNPSVIAGVGVVQDVQELYNDMHRYLADSGAHSPDTPATACFLQVARQCYSIALLARPVSLA